MKLSELAAEVSDSPADQQDYEVVAIDEDNEEITVMGLRWDHNDKQVVLELDV